MKTDITSVGTRRGGTVTTTLSKGTFLESGSVCDRAANVRECEGNIITDVVIGREGVGAALNEEGRFTVRLAILVDPAADCSSRTLVEVGCGTEGVVVGDRTKFFSCITTSKESVCCFVELEFPIELKSTSTVNTSDCSCCRSGGVFTIADGAIFDCLSSGTTKKF